MNSRIFQTSSILTLIFLTQTSCSFSLFSGEKSQDRSYIYGVGSSTISPLMASVSEEFSRTQAIKGLIIETPVVESTGTIEGIKAFCDGSGKKFPDFVSASRPIHNDEIRICNQNAVKEIFEIKIGYDGIVLATSSQNKKINLTKEQIFLALAKRVVDRKTGKLIKNPYKKWSEIDSKLPNNEILVYGPPSSSGTRDVFVDIMMNGVCFSDKKLIAAYPDEVSRKEECSPIREDGHFIESGENDALIAKNLKNNPDAFGIVGFNFLVANKSMNSASINGVKANFSNITSKKYSLSRPLYVYFKKENLTLIPRLGEFVNELISNETLGRKGYLTHNGLVPLSDKEIGLLQKNIRPLVD
jgi:phosphate transport system substrate-binding protein